MSATQSWFGTVDDDVLAPDSGRSARRGRCRSWRRSAPALRLQVVLAHQAADLLVVHDDALLAQRGADTAIAVASNSSQIAPIASTIAVSSTAATGVS